MPIICPDHGFIAGDYCPQCYGEPPPPPPITASQIYLSAQPTIGDLLAEKDKLIATLERQLAEARQNAVFFKSCALSGEVPEPGAEPFPPDTAPPQETEQ